MNGFRKLGCFALLLASLAPLASAGTLNVGPLGSGAAYLTVAGAVAAASPGDTILVQAGTYKSIGAVVVDIPLTIVGAGSSLTRMVASPPTVFGDEPPALRIQNLGGGQTVRVIGIELTSSNFGLPSAVAVVITQCVGSVGLADVKCTTGTGQFIKTEAAAIVRDSIDVRFDRCSMVAFGVSLIGGQGQQLGPMGQAGLFAKNSTVFVNNCSIAGADGLPAGGPFDAAVKGGAGILAVDSTVRLSRSDVSGGAGGIGTFNKLAGNGGPALDGQNSVLNVRGGDHNQLVGGAGALFLTSGSPKVGFGSVAIMLDLTASVTVTIDASLTAGLDGDGTATAALFGGPGLQTPVGESLATIEVKVSVAAPGATATLLLAGQPLSTDLAFFGLQSASPLAVTGIFGDVLMDVGQLTILPGVVLDATGHAALSFPLPASPGGSGQTGLFQSLAISPSGIASFSGPALLAIF